MRLMWLLPLAYVAGEYGFAVFAPYLGVLLGAVFLLRRSRPMSSAAAQVATNPTAAARS